MKDNPVFWLFAGILAFMIIYGCFAEIRISYLETQMKQVQRIQRGN